MNAIHYQWFDLESVTVLCSEILGRFIFNVSLLDKIYITLERIEDFIMECTNTAPCHALPVPLSVHLNVA